MANITGRLKYSDGTFVGANEVTVSGTCNNAAGTQVSAGNSVQTGAGGTFAFTPNCANCGGTNLTLHYTRNTGSKPSDSSPPVSCAGQALGTVTLSYTKINPV